MRKLVWPGGQTIVVYALPNHSELHQKFSKEILKIFPYQLERTWKKLAYSGLGKIPIVVNSVTELKQAVKVTPGAIGYINQAAKGDLFNVIRIGE